MVEQLQGQPKEETVTISKKEYEALVRDSNWLSCLESAGVDNWQGYDYAGEIYRDSFLDENE